MMLEVHRLSAFYGRAQILFDVSLHVARGTVVALLGRNGAGKSTTLKAIAGLIASRRGRIVFNGDDISTTPTHRIVRRGLGYVPEDRRIFTGLSVGENLDVGRQPPRPGAPHWNEDRVLALFPNLAALRGRPAGQISGGEQQMLTIARTLMGQPSLLMLDEPSEGLAPIVVDHLADAIIRMKADGLSILLSEQNLKFARAISDGAYIIEKGRIRFEGSMTALAADETLGRTYLAL